MKKNIKEKKTSKIKWRRKKIKENVKEKNRINKERVKKK